MGQRSQITMLTVAVASLALGAMLAFAVILVYDRESAPEIIIDDPRTGGAMVVSVQGAVATPGVYQLSGDARLKNAVDAAGGTTENADLASINMAERIYDEQEIDIPAKQAQSQGLIAGTIAPTAATASLININTASAAELDTLPGIGETYAARIIAYREEHGPFKSVDELAQVDGISLAMVDELRPLITV
jgi:competence protein ComEA